jgi:predicted  nucleic acid-binding Zn-ribbon protein
MLMQGELVQQQMEAERVTQQILALQSQVSTLKLQVSQIRALQSQVLQIRALQSRVSTLKSQVARLPAVRSENSTLRSQVSALQSENSKLQSSTVTTSLSSSIFLIGWGGLK